MFPVFVGGAGSNLQANVRTTATGFGYNPSTQVLTGVNTLSGNSANVTLTAGSFSWIFDNAGNITKSSGNGVGNIGSTTNYFDTVYATSMRARYADLAEIYLADHDYIGGTVMSFGGDQEITITLINHDTKLAGVISTNPSYVMNSTAEGEFPLPLALVGRVPVRVLGPIGKGDLVTSSDIPGVACKLKMESYVPGCVLGKSLEDHTDSTIKIIEILVGKV
jgi:hypothetical protein